MVGSRTRLAPSQPQVYRRPSVTMTPLDYRRARASNRSPDRHQNHAHHEELVGPRGRRGQVRTRSPRHGRDVWVRLLGGAQVQHRADGQAEETVSVIAARGPWPLGPSEAKRYARRGRTPCQWSQLTCWVWTTQEERVSDHAAGVGRTREPQCRAPGWRLAPAEAQVVSPAKSDPTVPVTYQCVNAVCWRRPKQRGDASSSSTVSGRSATTPAASFTQKYDFWAFACHFGWFRVTVERDLHDLADVHEHRGRPLR